MRGRNLFDFSTMPVFLIGGGPSAGMVDLSSLHRHGVVIAINNSWRSLMCDFIFSADGSWVDRNYPAPLADHPAHKVFAIEGPRRWDHPEDRCTVLERKPGAELSTQWYECHYADNSGFGALDFAINHGARRICLIGYDMKPGKHWHGGYAYQTIAERNPEKWREWRDAFHVVAPEIYSRGVSVTNACADSSIMCFPFNTVERFIGR